MFKSTLNSIEQNFSMQVFTFAKMFGKTSSVQGHSQTVSGEMR